MIQRGLQQHRENTFIYMLFSKRYMWYLLSLGINNLGMRNISIDICKTNRQQAYPKGWMRPGGQHLCNISSISITV